MKPNELYDLIKTTEYKTIGTAIDYKVVYNEENNTMYVLFQESKQKIDWLFNLLNVFTSKVRIMLDNKLSFVKLGYGYNKAWNECETSVMLDIKEILCSEDVKKIVISGWSYGGGMCIPCAISLSKYFPEELKTVKHNVVSFGAPKTVKDKKSLEILYKLSDWKSYCHKNDIVSYVVPWFYGLNQIRLGADYSFFKLFNPCKWHCIYGDKSLYKD
jgi:hypothetical protein